MGNIYDPMFQIKGHVSGVTISKGGGHPLVNHSVFIRGFSSMGDFNRPLYVINGIIGADPNSLTAEDIESYNVLKSVAASAKYGAFGGNGVIEITTKKGGKNKPLNISFTSLLSIDQTANRMDILTADEYRHYAQTGTTIDGEPYAPYFEDGGASIDYQDELYQTAITHQQHLSIDGTYKNTSYRGSITYRDQPGLVVESEKKDIGTNFSLSHKAFQDKLSLNAQYSFRKIEYEGIDVDDKNGIIYQTNSRNPTDPIYDEDGEFYNPPRVFQYFNPQQIMANYTNKEAFYYNNLNLSADYEIFEGLNVGLLGGFGHYSYESEEQIYPFNSMYSPDTLLNDDQTERVFYNLSPKVNYHKKIDKHQLKAEVGYNYYSRRKRTIIEYFNLFDGIEDEYTYITRLLIQGSNIALSYDYADKYYTDLLYRFDQKNYEKTRYVRYDNELVNYKSYSAALGWNLHNESFIQNVDFINALQLEVSYGEAFHEMELNKFILEHSYNNPFGSVNSINSLPMAAPDRLKDNEYNLRLRSTLLNNRIHFEGNYYHKTTDNNLSGIPMVLFVPPFIQYYEYAAINNEVVNKGLELDLNVKLIDKKHAKWNTGINFSKNLNKLTDFERELRITSPYIRGFVGEYNLQILSEGNSLYTFDLAEYVTVLDNQMVFNSQMGQYTTSIYNAVKDNSATIFPDYQIGWQNRMELPYNIDLQFSLRYVKGHSIYNVDDMALQRSSFPSLNILGSNMDDNFWNPQISTYFIEDASYLRLDNIVLGYNLDLKKWIKDGSIRVFAGANNLFTITDFTGLDPEITYTGGEMGVAYNEYPPIRSFFFGVTLNY
jgi:TonB-dependent SusC/RagA subfamily outer membrane receptor